MMKRKKHFRWITFLLIVGLTLMACMVPLLANPNDSSVPTLVPTIIVLDSTPTLKATITQPVQVTLETPSAQPTDLILIPTFTHTQPPPTLVPTSTPVPTNSPMCTILQKLNFRTGPGTAYHPPIYALSVQTVVIPIGYFPAGYPDGSWIQVQDPSNQQIGWVSAGAEFVSCNLDFATLPQVVVAPPPTPIPPRVQSSTEDGNCLGGSLDSEGVHFYRCVVVFSSGFPIQFQVFRDEVEVGREGGVQYVTFSVWRNNQIIYSVVEENIAYCFFTGNTPCNTWFLDGYAYKWGPEGPVVEAGTYTVSIDATMDDLYLFLHWEMDITITFD